MQCDSEIAGVSQGISISWVRATRGTAQLRGLAPTQKHAVYTAGKVGAIYQADQHAGRGSSEETESKVTRPMEGAFQTIMLYINNP